MKEDAESFAHESHSQRKDLAITLTLLAAALFTFNLTAVKEPILTITKYFYFKIRGFEGRINTS